MDTSKTEQQFATDSGIPVKRVYTREDIANLDPYRDLGAPGEAPFTRGVYPDMYRNRPWRIRQLTGHGTVEDQRDRIRYALSVGETGVTVLQDMATICMWDLDHPEIAARKDDVGISGSPLMSLRDWEIIFEDIPLDKIYGAIMGSPQNQAFLFGCHFALAENRGIPLSNLAGTGMQDMCTCYIAAPSPDQVAPSRVLRLVGDTIEFCAENLPHWTPASFSGYNIRESGITAYQEIATVLANAIVYIEEVLNRGKLKIDDFASGLAAAHLSCDRDFFEEVAKFRAIRRMWCRLLGERYQAQDRRSMKFRIHIQTAGSSLTYQQPLNNIVRVAYQVLAAALGGVQSMNADHYDEAYSVPSEEAALLAIRTQQIAQCEINITNVADPLGGSYYVESLTNEIEERAWDYLKKIEEQGGFLAALESGWLHREHIKAMLEEEKKKVTGQKKTVGLNCFQMEEEPFKVPAFQIEPNVWEKEMAKLEKLRRERDKSKVAQALGELRRALETGQNIMRPSIEAMKAYVTVGEMGQLWREVFPTWNPPISSVR